MKSLVLYYSFSGNTRLIAETVAKELNADLEELKPVKPLNASGAGYVMWGLHQLVGQNKPPLLPLEHEPNAYDLLILGTPVWSYTVAPPIRTFLEEASFNGKKIGNYGKTLDDMKNAMTGNEIIGATDFYDPLKHDPAGNRQKAAAWANTVKQTRECFLETLFDRQKLRRFSFWDGLFDG